MYSHLEHIISVVVPHISLKRNIWQLMEERNRKVYFNIKGTETLFKIKSLLKLSSIVTRSIWLFRRL